MRGKGLVLTELSGKQGGRANSETEFANEALVGEKRESLIARRRKEEERAPLGWTEDLERGSRNDRI